MSLQVGYLTETSIQNFFEASVWFEKELVRLGSRGKNSVTAQVRPSHAVASFYIKSLLDNSVKCYGSGQKPSALTSAAVEAVAQLQLLPGESAASFGQRQDPPEKAERNPVKPPMYIIIKKCLRRCKCDGWESNRRAADGGRCGAAALFRAGASTDRKNETVAETQFMSRLVNTLPHSISGQGNVSFKPSTSAPRKAVVADVVATCGTDVLTCPPRHRASGSALKTLRSTPLDQARPRHSQVPRRHS
ncbi:hypothetical protein EVAR_60217_1 [Eumeta japonica]|uniref:Uncharacterized protein n=1 Tax=Eumeta variegata TaxID=151549 RepID=A0A4C1ZAS1_EUMVA|nr:hypothetical protein EVAR_60217_1 [Eumeta japonica]